MRKGLGAEQMRILHVVPYLPKASGVTTFVVESSMALLRMGVEQEIAVRRRLSDEAITTGVPKIGVKEALAEIGSFDVVHLHGIWPPFLHHFVKAACRQNVHIVWSIHGMLSPWAMKYKWWKKVLPWFLWQKRDLRSAKILHVTSEKELTWVRSRGYANRIVNIPLGTRLPESVTPCSHEVKTLLFVGRINPIKGLENLIQAWKSVLRGDWKLRIVGTDAVNYQRKLIALSRNLSLQDCVEFPGPRFGSDLEKEYERADALVLPSFTENFGGVVVDALARGLPVVTSRGTPWEDVAETHCGWWVDNTPGALSKALQELISLSDDDRLEMGIRGRELVREKYSWNAVANQMKNVYEVLI